MQILILEDDPGIVSFLEKGLHAEGYRTTVVASGAEARVALEEPRNDIDLVLLDLGLPSDDGVKVLREWRSEGHDIPVIILTARAEVSDKVAGLNVGRTTMSPSRSRSTSSWPGSAPRCAPSSSRAPRSWSSSISVSTS